MYACMYAHVRRYVSAQVCVYKKVCDTFVSAPKRSEEAPSFLQQSRLHDPPPTRPPTQPYQRF